MHKTVEIICFKKLVPYRRLVRFVLSLPKYNMSLLSRQQATQNWHKSDPGVHFGDLLEALGMYKDIATDHGLNFSAHQSWRFGDPHKKSGEHDYEINQIDGEEVLPGPKWKNLFRWLVSQAHEFHDYDTVYLVTDNRDLVAGSLTEVPGLNHWPMVAACWAGTYILDACVCMFPATNFALIDSDCVPVTLFEIQNCGVRASSPLATQMTLAWQTCSLLAP